MKYTWLSVFVIISIFFAVFAGAVSADNFSASAGEIRPVAADANADEATDQNSSNASTVSSNEVQMKTIGVIGGVSWVSSIEYYRLMNEMVSKELGGLHSAKVLMYSVEFGEVSDEERLAGMGDWVALTETMIDAAQRLERGGADFIIIASNTFNSLADDIQANVQIPVLHIADSTGERVRDRGIKNVALLGTKYTMENDFYRDRLEKKYGLNVITPNETEMDYINSVIFDELCAGKFYNESRVGYIQIINRLIDEEGADGVILGCTEIPLLIKQEDVTVPVFDTMTIHVEAAVKYALSNP
ncbi:MAG TPA: aspartate/glutamate racemase family protein [Methanothrix sp.]|nr:aspartate/glutamate racemase family protein [Methanothrix sp.]HPR66247.1 aspartate/glutamate racemase family protein [Methanothrix sp.]